MFDCDAPQFCDFENPEHNDNSDFFELHHPNQEKTPRRRRIDEITTGDLKKSAKKHSMFTRQDATDDSMTLRNRSVPRPSAAPQEADDKRKRKSALKNHSISTLTVPVTPLLLTKTRSRPTEALSYEDRVLAEVDEFNRTKTIPLPLKRSILEAPPAVNLPHISTVPAPFNITNHEKKEITQEKPELFIFKAQPLPRSIYNKKQHNLVKPYAVVKAKYLLRKNKIAIEQENPGSSQIKKFKAKKPRVLYESPFKPKKSGRPPLMPKNIVLHTAVRAQIRKEFYEGRAKRLINDKEIL